MARTIKQIRRNPKPQSQADDLTVPPILRILRVVVGPGIVIAGFAMMFSSFGWGIVLVYLGFFVCLMEAIYEPGILKWPYAIQVVIICAVFAAVGVFTIEVVHADAPLNILAYSGGAGDDVLNAGIPSNQQFEYVRVDLNNPSPEDYQNLNIVINPNAWTHKAAIVDGPKSCTLSEEEGAKIETSINKKSGPDSFTATQSFGKFNLRDSSENTYTILAVSANYRLACDRLPSHFTVRIIFAAVTLNNDLLKPMQGLQLKPGEWGISAGEFKSDSPKDSIWDFLGPKPHLSIIKLVGTYAKSARSYSIDRIEKVGN